MAYSYTRWSIDVIEDRLDKGKIDPSDATLMYADVTTHYEENRISKAAMESLQRRLKPYIPND